MTLTFDSLDGTSILLIGQISRTMSVSGGSEYEINGPSARLADIQGFAVGVSAWARDMHRARGPGPAGCGPHATRSSAAT